MLHFAPTIQRYYYRFVAESNDPGGANQIREVLIHGNYLSQKDIEICLGFDIESLVAEPDHENMRDLHEVLRGEYGSDNTGGAVQ